VIFYIENYQYKISGFTEKIDKICDIADKNYVLLEAFDIILKIIVMTFVIILWYGIKLYQIIIILNI